MRGVFISWGCAIALAALGCARPQPLQVPPVTVAPVRSLPSVTGAPVAPVAAEPASSPAKAQAKEPPVRARFIEASTSIPSSPCAEVVVAVAEGKFQILGHALRAGDVLVIAHPDATAIAGDGLAVVAVHEPLCSVRDKPAPVVHVVRSGSVPELKFAHGAMAVHLDVPVKLSPHFYLGRLAGTAGVPEHVHETSWEILAAIDAAGTFVLQGEERRLGPRQVVAVPPGTKHAWRPDAGSTLRAIQIYAPPGPEQRFVKLADAEKRP